MSVSKNKPIENASDVIERFGGIRPMAKKIEVAVTTIQGWKKRDVIPAARRAKILELAAEYDVDLSDILVDAPDIPKGMNAGANENIKSEPEVQADVQEEAKVEDIVETESKVKTKTKGDVHAKFESKKAKARTDENDQDVKTKSVETRTDIDDEDALPKGLEEKIAEVEETEKKKSSAMVVIILLLILAGLLAIIWPQKDKLLGDLDRLSANDGGYEIGVREDAEVPVITPDDDAVVAAIIESELNTEQDADTNIDTNEEGGPVQEERSFFSDVIPEIPEDLGDRVADVQTKMGDAADQAKAASSEFIAEASAGVGVQANNLSDKLQAFTGSPVLARVLEDSVALRDSVSGPEQLNSIVEELSAVVRRTESELGQSIVSAGDSGANTFAYTLQAAKDNSIALQETFADVPKDDLQAATLLLAMTQFRASLDRDGEAFEDDLKVVRSLIGENNPELVASLERLAPHAQSGVLTPSGLTGEFKSLAGDAVVASLKGEDVSIKERARARMNTLFQVEKNGELLTGTPLQGEIKRAEDLLNEGDIEGAIGVVDGLDAQSQEILSPWIEKARASMGALNMKEMLGRMIDVSAYGVAGQVVSDADGGNQAQVQDVQPEAGDDLGVKKDDVQNSQLEPIDLVQ